MIAYILNHIGYYWIIAFFISLFWVYDYHHAPKVKEDEQEDYCMYNICTCCCMIKRNCHKYEPQDTEKAQLSIGEYFSDFLVSFFGWICLYILMQNIQKGIYDTFNIFLASVAIISISGYGYKLFEKLNLK